LKILLADDDTYLLDVTAYALRGEGFNVILATDGRQAISCWEEHEPDVVILDVAMPHLNGFEVCRQIRQKSQTPVIMLTALHDDDDVVKGFHTGADDYVTKPFSPRQLVARVRAVWRRGNGGQQEPARELRVGDMLFDVDGHEVISRNLTQPLTRLEFRILYLLASNLGRVVSASRLVEYAWGYDGGDVSLLKTHISHIRKKLGLPQGGPGSITAVAGVGYRLYAPAQETPPDIFESFSIAASV
jgi:DNA-binding response OmpR family regulator